MVKEGQNSKTGNSDSQHNDDNDTNSTENHYEGNVPDKDQQDQPTRSLTSGVGDSTQGDNIRFTPSREEVSKDSEGDNNDSLVDINIEDGDGLNFNILQVSKARDLSPRHTCSLNGKSGKAKVPLQVRTRSKGKVTSSDQ